MAKKARKKKIVRKRKKQGGISKSETRKGSGAIVAERRAQSFDLRKKHLTYDEIAVALKISRSTAWKDVNAVVTDLQATTRETAAAVRTLELESLDEIERIARLQYRDANQAARETFYRKTVDGEFVQVQVLSQAKATRVCRIAAQTILDCKRRRAKMVGLDAPTKHLVEIQNVTRIFQSHNAMILRVVDKFVPRDLRLPLSQEFSKVLESSCRSIRPAHLENLN